LVLNLIGYFRSGGEKPWNFELRPSNGGTNASRNYVSGFCTDPEWTQHILEESMPVKEIITYVLGVIGALAVLHGPLHLKDELWKVEVQILRETARTDNWGNPSLFAHRRPVHAVPSFSRKLK